MTAEEQKSKPDTEIQTFWDTLNTEANSNFKRGFEHLLKSDEYQYNSDTYHFRMLKPKDVGLLRKLRSEEIDQDKEWDKYCTNVCQRACLLIKDMDEEKFYDSDFYVLENLVTAWSVRAVNGFRPLV